VTPPLLEVEDLTVSFETGDGRLVAVDGIDFRIDRGETVCLVGESGSGKTVAAESLTRLIDEPPGRVEGAVRLDGTDVLSLPEPELRSVRGGDVAYVFQNPQNALNHCYTVGWQIVEAIRLHDDTPRSEARARAIELLDRVGIANAASRVDDYPHEFSGGQKQRVMIAMALATEPQLLVADEPTTALDVTVQAQILRLLEELQAEYGMGLLFITHDLAVVSEIADRVLILYAGKIMERGSREAVFERAAHPYTRRLLECIPGTGSVRQGIPGSLPAPTDPPDGCRFAPRCPDAVTECSAGGQPAAVEPEPGHAVACIHYHEGYDSDAVSGIGAGSDVESGSGSGSDVGGDAGE